MSSELFSHDPPPLNRTSHSSPSIPGYVHPVGISIRTGDKCLMARFENNISGAEIFSCINHYLEQNGPEDSVHLIADLRASSLNQLTAHSLQELAEGLEFWLEEKGFEATKLAIIATRSENQNGEMTYHRMSHTLLQNVRILPRLDEALDWIETLP